MAAGVPSSVLLVTPRWTRDGGVAAHVEASARVLAGAGIEVDVLVARIESSAPAGDLTLHESPRLFDGDAPTEVRLGPAGALGHDVAHLHQVDDPEIVAALRRRAPVVSSVHAYSLCTSGVHYFRPGHECERPHGPGCVPNLLLRGCAHTRHPKQLPPTYPRVTRRLRALREVDLAVSYSHTIDRHLAANGIARRAIVPLFPTLPAASASGHEQRRRVLFAGRVVKPKGVDVLVRAAAEVQAEFVVCGEGVRLEHVRRLARRLGVQDRIDFRGWVGPEDLSRELAEASVVALPSRWPEPFGLVGIEAMACGRPVVASLTGGVAEWLQDGVNGLAVPPSDHRALAAALTELLDDPARQREMGLAGRQLVATRFSPAAHLQGLLQAYAAATSAWRPAAAAPGDRPSAGARAGEAAGAGRTPVS